MWASIKLESGGVKHWHSSTAAKNKKADAVVGFFEQAALVYLRLSAMEDETTMSST